MGTQIQGSGPEPFLGAPVILESEALNLRIAAPHRLADPDTLILMAKNEPHSRRFFKYNPEDHPAIFACAQLW